MARKPLPNGYDRVGLFHPYIVWAAVVALDVLIICAALAILLMIGDAIDDAIWPGGFDWIPLL